ncbi:MAG: hypothetical protein ACYC0V_02060 [Armatimonadota bacterium]
MDKQECQTFKIDAEKSIAELRCKYPSYPDVAIHSVIEQGNTIVMTCMLNGKTIPYPFPFEWVEDYLANPDREYNSLLNMIQDMLRYMKRRNL